MATRFINMGLDATAPGGHVAGFCVDDEGKLMLNRGARFKGSLSSDPGQEHIPTRRVILATAALTLTPADSGALVLFDSTTAFTITLPATQKGLTYSIHAKQLPGSGTHALDVQDADKFMYDGKADGATLVWTAAADAIGDGITVVGDGDEGWYVVSVVEATPDNIT